MTQIDVVQRDVEQRPPFVKVPGSFAVIDGDLCIYRYLSLEANGWNFTRLSDGKHIFRVFDAIIYAPSKVHIEWEE